jgi:hypothetical protein
MKKKQLKVARTILCLVALVVVGGCSTARVSEKSWSQTAAKEEREQQRSASPQGDWEVQR